MHWEERYHDNRVDHALSLPDERQHVVGHVPCDVIHCTRGGVRPDDGRATQLERLQRSGIRSVGEIDQHAEAVHLAHERAADIAKTEEGCQWRERNPCLLAERT